MEIFTRQQRRGFSLIELMIVVAIFSVLSTLGFGLTRETLPRYRARRGADQFASNVHTCRMLAIQSGYECRILMSDYDDKPSTLTADNAGEYYIQLGNKSVAADEFETLPTSLMEVEGSFDISKDSTHYLRNVSIMDWGTINGTNGAGTNSIVFSPRGFLANPATDFNDGYVTISFVNKVAYSDGTDDIYKVNIARSGMTRIISPLMGERYPEADHGTGKSSTSD
jgi:prepilin-type N-terminal cleavage/methylation domain-containing protein